MILLGAGDFAREVLWFASEVPAEQRDWDVHGLLDDQPEVARERLLHYGVHVPVLGRIADYQPQAGDCFLPAIGSVQGKLKVCEMMRERGAAFTNLIHPLASVGSGTRLGKGIVLCRHSLITVNCCVGDYVTMLPYAVAGHDVVIEDGCTVATHCAVNGHAHLERGVFLGSHAVVLPSARVGAMATVGAGSVVLKRVPAGATVFGVPAKRIDY